MFNLLHSSMNQENCSKSTSGIKVATMNNMDSFGLARKPSHVTTKLTHFSVNNDEWKVHEEYIVHTYVKDTSLAEASKSEKSSPYP